MGGEHGAKRRLVTAQVGDEHLDGRAGQRRAHGRDGGRELRGAAVRQVVARHARDDHVPQTQAPCGDRQARRLAGVEGAEGGRVCARRPSV